ncbi:hypothetical protein EC957_002033 [Mortierella hygrophila]|uniref:Uncharacterized protein n=1 Tax=Mortierella hygrophila TaxID=979708 RepID=A0A9P6K7G4_9FUNG|nr:hypothetical protein EC957_002033 [Mortierella hygrophila]
MPAPVEPTEDLSPDFGPVRIPAPVPTPAPDAPTDDLPWDEFINFDPESPGGSSQKAAQPPTLPQYRPITHYTLPTPVAPSTSTNMQRLWLTEGVRAKFHMMPKPRILRETHLKHDDPLYLPTKQTLLAQVAAGKYTECLFGREI